MPDGVSCLLPRGAVRVDFAASVQSGVTGVVANVVSLLTGAAGDTGFQGLAGQFKRRNLLFFGTDIPGTRATAVGGL